MVHSKEAPNLDPFFYWNVEKKENVKNIIYGDTDSIFIHLLSYDEMQNSGYSFDTEEDIKKTDEELVQPFAKKLNEFLKESWQNDVLNYLNIEPEFNTLDFKTEIVLDAIAFFSVKKKYFLNLVKEEEVVFKDGKVKITGLEAVRSDVAKFTKEMMKDIIQTFLKYRKNLEVIPEEYLKVIKKWGEIFEEKRKSNDLFYLGIPSSWSAREYKKEPSYVLGAKFWNTFIRDEIRPGKKSVRLAIKFNKFIFPRVFQKFKQEQIKQKTSNEFNIGFKLDLTKKPFNNPSALMEKITFIFVPPGVTPGIVIKKLKEIGVEIDYQEQKKKIFLEKIQLFDEVVEVLKRKE